jgi:hypothetical protein
MHYKEDLVQETILHDKRITAKALEKLQIFQI